ncbi:calcium/sodium antiporter [Patescibacteria group bacterium]
MFLGITYTFVLFLSFFLLALIVEEYFVPTLDKISSIFKLSPDIAGATLMAAGSSAPELFISLFALIKPGDYANVGAGTIVGSAIFNVLVIIGISAAFKAAKLRWQPVIRDLLFYCLSIIVLLISFWDGILTTTETGLFVGMYLLYLGILIFWKKFVPYNDINPIEETTRTVSKNAIIKWTKRFLTVVMIDRTHTRVRLYASFFLSIGWIGFLSYVLVESGIALGEMLHINPTIIALTILAAGTSVPDLFSSVIVAREGRGDMAVSNAIGSNIFDILIGVGLPWFIILTLRGSNIVVDTENLIGSVMLLFATVIAILFLLIIRKWRIGKRSGLLLVGLYIVYIIYNITRISS